MSLDHQQSTHPVLGALGIASSALKDVRDVQPVFMTAGEKGAAITALARLKAQAAELEARVLAAISEAEVQEAGCRDVAGWLATTTRADRSEARAAARLAAAVDRRWSGVAAGMADGEVSVAQARVIAEALEALPERLGAETLGRAEQTLVGYAATFAPGELRRIGRRILEVVAPEIAEAEEAKRLADEETQARDRASLRLRPLGNGLTRGGVRWPV